MCLAIPYKLIEVDGAGTGVIETGGRRREISLALIPEAKAGDWVLTYLGAATARLDDEEAGEILAIFQAVEEAAVIPD